MPGSQGNGRTSGTSGNLENKESWKAILSRARVNDKTEAPKVETVQDVLSLRQGHLVIAENSQVIKSLSLSRYACTLKQVTEPLEDLSALSCGKVTELWSREVPSSSMKAEGKTLQAQYGKSFRKHLYASIIMRGLCPDV